MCGIAGFIGRRESGIEFLYSSLECLKHRGPDGSDLVDLEWAGLCHTRLALITPGPDGSQPVEGGKTVVSFNGEIYNWKELAIELQKNGVRANLNSDSKVLVYSIEVWGLDLALEKLRGIFAFALLDKERRTLKLVRDSAGTKPLYYFQSEGSTFFSSEIKSFLKFGLKVDIEQLHDYMTFQNFLGDKTLFENVFLVPAGSILHFSSPSAPPAVQIWDEGLFTSPQNYSLDEATSELTSLMEKSIDRNLVADFPIGVFLSGGLDSSTIAQFSAKKKQNTLSYTIGFKSDLKGAITNFKDERNIAKIIATYLNIQNLDFEVSHDDMEREFDAICWAIEEPRVGQSYPNFFAARLARTQGKAVLSGAGGDELFGGYVWRYREALGVQAQGKDSQLSAYLGIWHRLGSFREISQILSISEVEHVRNAKAKIEAILEVNSRNLTSYELQDLLYFEYKTFLQGLLLVDDKIAMSQGLEIRVPFLDQDLVQFGKSLPNEMRIKLGSIVTPKKNTASIGPGNESEGKLLLRNLARQLKSPANNLPKQGFSGPDESWFRVESSEFVRSRIMESSSELWNYLDYKSSVKMVSEHLDGTRNNKSLIWSLLSLESVLRQFRA